MAKARIGILDSAILAIAEKMANTDLLALHFIKMSAGFAQAYPEESAEYAELYRQKQAVENEIELLNASEDTENDANF